MAVESYKSLMSFMRHNMPEQLTPVLAWTGSMWVRAIWVAEKCRRWIHAQDPDELRSFDDASETAYWREGWYEVFDELNGSHFDVKPLESVLAWQDLPPAPTLR